MKIDKNLILIAAGAALVFAALSLFLHNRHEDAEAGKASESLMPEVRSVIAERETIPLQTMEPLNPELTVVDIDGYGYVGYLSVPVLELELPVMSEWDYARLKIAPCRQFGSSKTDDLVIAGHNYEKHFGRLSELEPGDEVLFSDMDGNVNGYKVASVVTLGPTEVEAVQSSEHDLVLYTCTYGGKTRVTVFCDRPGDVREAECETQGTP